VVIGKVCCASAARRNKGNRVCPIAIGCAGVDVCGRSRNCPFLKIGACISILNNNSFSLNKQRQENINIFVVVRQMADVNAGRANLCGVVPQNMPVAGVT
jgi:hypothetical protein